NAWIRRDTAEAPQDICLSDTAPVKGAQITSMTCQGLSFTESEWGAFLATLTGLVQAGAAAGTAYGSIKLANAYDKLAGGAGGSGGGGDGGIVIYQSTDINDIVKILNKTGGKAAGTSGTRKAPGSTGGGGNKDDGYQSQNGARILADRGKTYR